MMIQLPEHQFLAAHNRPHTTRINSCRRISPSFEAHRSLDASQKKLDDTNGILHNWKHVKLSNR